MSLRLGTNCEASQIDFASLGIISQQGDEGLEVSVLLQYECEPYLISRDYPHLHLLAIVRRSSLSPLHIARCAECIVVLGDFEWFRWDLTSISDYM